MSTRACAATTLLLSIASLTFAQEEGATLDICSELPNIELMRDKWVPLSAPLLLTARGYYITDQLCAGKPPAEAGKRNFYIPLSFSAPPGSSCTTCGAIELLAAGFRLTSHPISVKLIGSFQVKDDLRQWTANGVPFGNGFGYGGRFRAQFLVERVIEIRVRPGK